MLELTKDELKLLDGLIENLPKAMHVQATLSEIKKLIVIQDKLKAELEKFPPDPKVEIGPPPKTDLAALQMVRSQQRRRRGK